MASTKHFLLMLWLAVCVEDAKAKAEEAKQDAAAAMHCAKERTESSAGSVHDKSCRLDTNHQSKRHNKQREGELEGIKHRMVQVNGIKMHIAEKGEGPVVLLLHGFPELWYSWRHQILALSSHGYHAVAPDLRGYGDTDAPASISNYTCFQIVGDLIALLDYLVVDQVYLVAHDWGAIIGWYLCMFRSERVKVFVCLSVPFLPRNPKVKTIDDMRAKYGDDFYICAFQEPGKAEAAFAKIGTEDLLESTLTGRKPRALTKPNEGTGSNANDTRDLPSWLSQEDLAYFVSKFDKKGFTGGLNYYRNMDLNWELTAPWTGAQIKVPVKFITGDLDMVYNLLGIKDYIHGGDFKKDVPNLKEVVVLEGVSHFCNQEAAEEVNNHIYHFIKKF